MLWCHSYQIDPKNIGEIRDVASRHQCTDMWRDEWCDCTLLKDFNQLHRTKGQYWNAKWTMKLVSYSSKQYVLVIISSFLCSKYRRLMHAIRKSPIYEYKVGGYFGNAQKYKYFLSWDLSFGISVSQFQKYCLFMTRNVCYGIASRPQGGDVEMM